MEFSTFPSKKCTIVHLWPYKYVYWSWNGVGLLSSLWNVGRPLLRNKRVQENRVNKTNEYFECCCHDRSVSQSLDLFQRSIGNNNYLTHALTKFRTGYTIRLACHTHTHHKHYTLSTHLSGFFLYMYLLRY